MRIRPLRLFHHHPLLLLLFGILLSIFLIYQFFDELLFYITADEYPRFPTSIEDLLNDDSSASVPNLLLNNNTNIAIVSVLDNLQRMSEFQFALSTVHCYCQRQQYAHKVMVMSDDGIIGTENANEYRKCDRIGDFMFRRHCMVAVWMSKHPHFSWLLFLDADIAVVNPAHRLEQYIVDDGRTELILLERMFNFEIMAGSYLAKNTLFAHSFLHSWANYFHRLPNSFHGTDNGAIHALLMERYAGRASRNDCQHLWEKSRSFSDLFLFEACVRFHTNRKMERNGTLGRGKLKIVPKGKGWVRDGGWTRSRFSRRDFMLHGWKNSTFNRPVFNPWRNPFHRDQHFDLSTNCANASLEWKYKSGFFVEDEPIGEELDKFVERTKVDYKETLRRLKLIE